MPQVFLGYVKVIGSEYRRSIWRAAIGTPTVTGSDRADNLHDANEVMNWLEDLLENNAINTFHPLPDGIPMYVKDDIAAMLTTVVADAEEGKKSSIKLSLVDHLNENYDNVVLTLKAVITSAGVKSVAYFPLEADEEPA